MQDFPLFSGERGIRTPGASQHDGFQDRCNRPLYHLSLLKWSKSGCKVNVFFVIPQIFLLFFCLFADFSLISQHDLSA